MKKLDLTNQTFGSWLVIQKIPQDNYQTKYKCQCTICGSTKEIYGASLTRKNNPSRSCGCESRVNIKHQDSKSKEYKCWVDIKQRCTNPKNSAYHNYGARGISICNQWLNSYEQFISDVGKAPSKHHVIDRINNNGNYEPNNVRWTTEAISAQNKRVQINNTSGCRGVTFVKKSNKWRARISVNKNRINLGLFNTKEEAIQARKQAEQKLW